MRYEVTQLPPVALLGRSNVGKSSLLNALTRNWGVARTSDKPGLTQVIITLCFCNFISCSVSVCLCVSIFYSFHYIDDNCTSSADY